MREEDPILTRLEDQIEWYDRRSLRNQRFFKWLKMSEIIAAAIIPFAAGTGAPPIMTGGLGVLIVILEGLQHLNQYHHNWIMYRSTCEELKHEKYLYLGKAGPYSTATDAHALLAERIEAIISQEHAKWVAVQEQAAKVKGGTPR
ncbi:MAG: DUF4231 domain-containing protein [Anaerolineae bacterium]